MSSAKKRQQPVTEDIPTPTVFGRSPMHVEKICFVSHPFGKSSISHLEKREVDDREILFTFLVAVRKFSA
jgi:hypothetical protein